MKARKILRRIPALLLLAVLPLVALSFKSDKRITIFMIGDSTMANKDISGDKQERGWGMMLGNFFDETVAVDNHAVNGRSSKSFISEGRWDDVLRKITPGDYVIIQFGHNDEKKDTLRHTDPGTTFDANLRRFVVEARQKGARPILLNSVVRRNFSGSSTAVADDDLRDNSSKTLAEGDTLIDTHGAYLLSPLRVARETATPFVDANKITHDLEQGMGRNGSRKLHMIFAPGETPSLPGGRQDNTHYNIYGAYTVARLLADAICKAVPQLAARRAPLYDACVAPDGTAPYMSLQQAVDELPQSKKTQRVAVRGGEWQKPAAPKGKKIKYVMLRGARFIGQPASR